MTEKTATRLPQKDHLKKLRDLLGLPHDALHGDKLVFQVAGERHVVASHTKDGYLSLICELGTLDAMPATAWPPLLQRQSRARQPSLPHAAQYRAQMAGAGIGEHRKKMQALRRQLRG